MANMLLAYGNRIDGALLNDGLWTTGLPLVNLQNATLGRVARTQNTALTSTKFKADLGSSKLIRVVAIANHNASLDAQYRMRFSDVSDFSTLVSDSGWLDVWPVVYPFGTVEWDDDNFWTGQYTDEEIEGYTNTLIYILPAAIRARFWSVEFDDTANSAGYLQAGRAFIGDAWQPTRNLNVGASITFEDDTTVQKARSGAEYFDPRRIRRVARFTIKNLEEDEAYGRAYEVMRRSGVSGEVIFIFNPDDTAHAIRRQFLGRLRQLTGIEHPYPLNQSTGWEAAERL